MNAWSRMELLLGKAGLKRLQQSQVAVFGLGGVGSHAAEALARAGVGHLIIVDHDTVSVTNINRQLLALTETVGKLKTAVMEERLRQINPEIKVTAYPLFYSQETKDTLLRDNYDYVVDAVDTVTAKLDLIKTCRKRRIPLISSMGTANKLDPTQLKIGDISQTKICPLAKIMRKELRRAGITKGVKVVYSLEPPLKIKMTALEELPEGRRSLPGSISFVPGTAGFLLASAVVHDLLADLIPALERRI